MTYVSTSRAAPSGLLHRIAGLKTLAVTAIRQRRVYTKTLTELNALSDRELADLGISRIAIADIAREAAYGP